MERGEGCTPQEVGNLKEWEGKGEGKIKELRTRRKRKKKESHRVVRAPSRIPKENVLLG